MNARVFGLTIAAVLLAAFFAGRQKGSFTVEAVATSDPCAGSALKRSVPILGTAQNEELVLPVSGKAIYVCGFAISNTFSGATEFAYEATAGQCAIPGGGNELTGLFWASPTTPVIVGNSRQTVLVTPSGGGLCANSSSSAEAYGFVTYVQQ